MHILISVFVILLVLCFVAMLWVYNRLVLVQVNKDNALADMADDLDAAIAALPS